MIIDNTLIILATLSGPILAVQAQKAIERFKERRNRKLSVFSVLMATRAERLSRDHVQALNTIDLAFYGHRVLGIPHRSKLEQAVLDAWKEYLDHLNTKADADNLTRWVSDGLELFVNLLHAVSQDLGLKFDRVQLKRGAYSPIAHGDLENDQIIIRKELVKVLTGDRSLRMDVAGFAMDPAVVAAQLELQQRMRDVLGGEKAVNVNIKGDDTG